LGKRGGQKKRRDWGKGPDETGERNHRPTAHWGKEAEHFPVQNHSVREEIDRGRGKVGVSGRQRLKEENYSLDDLRPRRAFMRIKKGRAVAGGREKKKKLLRERLRGRNG